MSAALCALHDAIKADPRPYKNLLPSFTSILKQVRIVVEVVMQSSMWRRWW